MTEELFRIADKVFLGTATREDIAWLNNALADDEDSRRAFLRYALVHGQLPMTNPGLKGLNQTTDLPFCKTETPLTGLPIGNLSDDLGVSDPVSSTWVNWTNLTKGLVLLLGLICGASWLFYASHSQQRVMNSRDAKPIVDTTNRNSNYDNRTLPVHTVATMRRVDSSEKDSHSYAFSATTLMASTGETQFTSAGGADVRLQGPALFGVNSASSGILFRGSVHVSVDHADSAFSVHTSNLRIVDSGTDFQVTMLDDERLSVHVLNGEVDVQSRVRSPLIYWDFDDANRGNSEVEHKAEISFFPKSATLFTAGIVGPGAMAFNNTMDSSIQIQGGTGDEVGTGLFACSSGISIEAMIASRWTGELYDYDEIFRKEDGVHRTLLSFQNDTNLEHYSEPKITLGPVLSFGLHLEQRGYRELDMRLDGKNGRPTVDELCDGRPHHVVATYDSFSGRKQIYIDGRLRFEKQYPVGTLIVNGGPTPAEIGNFVHKEPFHGVIDEFAYYDFALTPTEIATHHRNASNGINYFGGSTEKPNEQVDESQWRFVSRITAGNEQVFHHAMDLILK